MIKSAKETINFFYICLFTISLLFFSAFYLKIYLNKRVVLGTEVDTSREVMFWQEFVLENPQYYEGWIELYNLTEKDEYLNKAKGVDPNR
ncbi:MAG: hypothetical protein NTV24_02195 [Candidatus Woesebacteria bacterium]|nr:hypothetical protein [Candidatus Woesebacteria bacterium]